MRMHRQLCKLRMNGKSAGEGGVDFRRKKTAKRLELRSRTDAAR